MPHGGELQSPSPVVSTISLVHIVPCTLEPPILVLVIFPLDVSLPVSLMTFLLSVTEESVLRDLKALLMEAKQKVPPFLHQLDSLTNDYLVVGGMHI